MNAYRAVSNKTLIYFQAKYKTDFEIFDYDKEPVDIYEFIADD